MDMNTLIHRLPKRSALDHYQPTSTSATSTSTSGRCSMPFRVDGHQTRPMPTAKRMGANGTPITSSSMPLQLPIFSAAPRTSTSMLGSLAPPQTTHMTSSTAMTSCRSTVPMGNGNANGNALTPLRFIIPSKKTNKNNTIDGVAASMHSDLRAQDFAEAESGPNSFLDHERNSREPPGEEEKENNKPAQPQRQDVNMNMNPNMDMHRKMNGNMKMEMSRPSLDNEDLNKSQRVKKPQSTSSTSSRKTKNTNRPTRSTKSKARPGLRKGKWTEEESRYAEQLTYYFKEGLLPIERGTMLRLFLSQKLNCEPMRITKKFTGDDCIGKQVFRPCSPTPDTQARIMQAQIELLALEAAFYKRLKASQEFLSPEERDDGIAQTLSKAKHVESNDSLVGMAMRKRPLRSSKLTKSSASSLGSDDEQMEEDDSDTTDDSTAGREEDQVQDANAVGLLLDFFYKANRSNHRIKHNKPSSSSSSSPSERGQLGNDEADPEDFEPSPIKKRRVTEDVRNADCSSGKGSAGVNGSGSVSSSQPPRVEREGYALCATI